MWLMDIFKEEMLYDAMKSAKIIIYFNEDIMKEILVQW